MASNHVVTEKIRVAYPHLFEPHAANEKAEPKYSVRMLIPKSDTVTKARIDAAIEAAKQRGKQDRWGGVIPPVIALPIYDGDGVQPMDGMPYPDYCHGNWVINASRRDKPEVVDTYGNPIINPSEIYGGMIARVSCDFFPYMSSGKRGIGCALCNVQKCGDGEPIGAAVATAASDFGSAFDPLA